MTLSQNVRLRSYVLAFFYLVQGIPMGFVSIGLTGYLVAAGASSEEIATLLAAAWVPWALKMVFAPMMDRRQSSPMGRRRPWLVLAQAGMVLSSVVLLFSGEPSLHLVLTALIIVVHNAFGSLQDVAVDAMAVDLLAPEERGRANGIMWAGKIGGMSIGAAGAGTLLATVSWTAAIMVLLIPSFVAALAALVIREQQSDVRLSIRRNRFARKGRTDRERLLMPLVFRALKKEQAAWLAVMALVGSLPARMMITLAPTFVVQHVGWSEASFAQFAGGPTLIAGATGALLGGWLADRYSRRRVLLLGTILIGLFLLILGLSQPLWQSSGVVMTSILGITAADMMVRITLFSLYMGACRPAIAATQYTIYMALGNLCNVVGSLVVALLGLWVDIDIVFIAGAAFSILTLILFKQIKSAS